MPFDLSRYVVPSAPDSDPEPAPVVRERFTPEDPVSLSGVVARRALRAPEVVPYRDQHVNVLGRSMTVGDVSRLEGGRELLRLTEANKTSRRGFLEAVTDVGTKDLPVIGDISGAVLSIREMRRVAETFQALEEGREVSEQDLVYAQLFMTDQERKSMMNWRGKTGEILRAMPGHMADMRIYGYLAFGGGEAAKWKGVFGAIKAVLPHAAKTAAAGAAVPDPVTTAAGAVASAGMILSAPIKAALRRAAGKKAAATMGSFFRSTLGSKYMAGIGKGLAEGVKGGAARMALDTPVDALLNVARGLDPLESRDAAERLIGQAASGEGLNIRQAQMAAMGAELVEYISENTGQAFTAALFPGANPNEAVGRALNNMANRVWGQGSQKALRAKLAGATGFKGYLSRAVLKGGDLQAVGNALQQYGYNGWAEEMLEERYSGFLNGLLGFAGDERGLKNAFKQAGWASWDDFVAESVAFAVPMAGALAIESGHMRLAGLKSDFETNLGTAINASTPANLAHSGNRAVEGSSESGLVYDMAGREVFRESVESAIDAIIPLAQAQDAQPKGVLPRIGHAMLNVASGLMQAKLWVASGYSNLNQMFAQMGLDQYTSLYRNQYNGVLAQAQKDGVGLEQAKVQADAAGRQVLRGVLTQVRNTYAVQENIVSEVLAKEGFRKHGATPAEIETARQQINAEAAAEIARIRAEADAPAAEAEVAPAPVRSAEVRIAEIEAERDSMLGRDTSPMGMAMDRQIRQEADAKIKAIQAEADAPAAEAEVAPAPVSAEAEVDAELAKVEAKVPLSKRKPVDKRAVDSAKAGFRVSNEGNPRLGELDARLTLLLDSPDKATFDARSGELATMFPRGELSMHLGILREVWNDSHGRDSAYASRVFKATREALKQRARELGLPDGGRTADIKARIASALSSRGSTPARAPAPAPVRSAEVRIAEIEARRAHRLRRLDTDPSTLDPKEIIDYLNSEYSNPDGMLDRLQLEGRNVWFRKGRNSPLVEYQMALDRIANEVLARDPGMRHGVVDLRAPEDGEATQHSVPYAMPKIADVPMGELRRLVSDPQAAFSSLGQMMAAQMNIDLSKPGNPAAFRQRLSKFLQYVERGDAGRFFNSPDGGVAKARRLLNGKWVAAAVNAEGSSALAKPVVADSEADLAVALKERGFEAGRKYEPDVFLAPRAGWIRSPDPVRLATYVSEYGFVREGADADAVKRGAENYLKTWGAKQDGEGNWIVAQGAVNDENAVAYTLRAGDYQLWEDHSEFSLKHAHMAEPGNEGRPYRNPEAVASHLEAVYNLLADMPEDQPGVEVLKPIYRGFKDNIEAAVKTFGLGVLQYADNVVELVYPFDNAFRDLVQPLLIEADPEGYVGFVQEMARRLGMMDIHGKLDRAAAEQQIESLFDPESVKSILDSLALIVEKKQAAAAPRAAMKSLHGEQERIVSRALRPQAAKQAVPPPEEKIELPPVEVVDDVPAVTSTAYSDEAVDSFLEQDAKLVAPAASEFVVMGEAELESLLGDGEQKEGDSGAGSHVSQALMDVMIENPMTFGGVLTFVRAAHPETANDARLLKDYILDADRTMKPAELDAVIAEFRKARQDPDYRPLRGDDLREAAEANAADGEGLRALIEATPASQQEIFEEDARLDRAFNKGLMAAYAQMASLAGVDPSVAKTKLIESVRREGSPFAPLNPADLGTDVAREYWLRNAENFEKSLKRKFDIREDRLASSIFASLGLENTRNIIGVAQTSRVRPHFRANTTTVDGAVQSTKLNQATADLAGHFFRDAKNRAQKNFMDSRNVMELAELIRTEVFSNPNNPEGFNPAAFVRFLERLTGTRQYWAFAAGDNARVAEMEAFARHIWHQMNPAQLKSQIEGKGWGAQQARAKAMDLFRQTSIVRGDGTATTVPSNFKKWMESLPTFGHAVSVMKPNGGRVPGFDFDTALDKAFENKPGFDVVRIDGEVMLNRVTDTDGDGNVKLDDEGSPVTSLADTDAYNDDEMSVAQRVRLMEHIWREPYVDPRDESQAKKILFIPSLGAKTTMYAVLMPAEVAAGAENFDQAYKMMSEQVMPLLFGSDGALSPVQQLKRGHTLSSGGRQPLIGIEGGIETKADLLQRVKVLKGKVLDGAMYGVGDIPRRMAVSLGRPDGFTIKAHVQGRDADGQPVLLKSAIHILPEGVDTFEREMIDVARAQGFDYVTDEGGAKIFNKAVAYETHWDVAITPSLFYETTNLEHPADTTPHGLPKPMYSDISMDSFADLEAHLDFVNEALRKDGLPQAAVNLMDEGVQAELDHGVSPDSPRLQAVIQMAKAAATSKIMTLKGSSTMSTVLPAGPLDAEGVLADKYLKSYDLHPESRKLRSAWVRMNAGPAGRNGTRYGMYTDMSADALVKMLEDFYKAPSERKYRNLLKQFKYSHGGTPDAKAGIQFWDMFDANGRVRSELWATPAEAPDGSGRVYVPGTTRIDNRTPAGAMHAHRLVSLTEPVSWRRNEKTGEMEPGRENFVKMHPEVQEAAGLDFDGDQGNSQQQAWNTDGSLPAYPEGAVPSGEQALREWQRAVRMAGSAKVLGTFLAAYDGMDKRTRLPAIHKERFDSVQVPDPADPAKLVTVKQAMEHVPTDSISDLVTRVQLEGQAVVSVSARGAAVAGMNAFRLLDNYGGRLQYKSTLTHGLDAPLNLDTSAGTNLGVLHGAEADIVNIVIDNLSDPRAGFLGFTKPLLGIYMAMTRGAGIRSEADLLAFAQKWATWLQTPVAKAYVEASETNPRAGKAALKRAMVAALPKEAHADVDIVLELRGMAQTVGMLGRYENLVRSYPGTETDLIRFQEFKTGTLDKGGAESVVMAGMADQPAFKAASTALGLLGDLAYGRDTMLRTRAASVIAEELGDMGDGKVRPLSKDEHAKLQRRLIDAAELEGLASRLPEGLLARIVELYAQGSPVLRGGGARAREAVRRDGSHALKALTAVIEAAWRRAGDIDAARRVNNMFLQYLEYEGLQSPRANVPGNVRRFTSLCGQTPMSDAELQEGWDGFSSLPSDFKDGVKIEVVTAPARQVQDPVTKRWTPVPAQKRTLVVPGEALPTIFGMVQVMQFGDGRNPVMGNPYQLLPYGFRKQLGDDAIRMRETLFQNPPKGFESLFIGKAKGRRILRRSYTPRGIEGAWPFASADAKALARAEIEAPQAPVQEPAVAGDLASVGAVEPPAIAFEASRSGGYPARTFANAAAADVTIDFAMSPVGSGGRSGLTRIAAEKAGKVYINIPVKSDGFDPATAARAITDAIKQASLKNAALARPFSVNLAGHELGKMKLPQAEIDSLVDATLKKAQMELAASQGNTIASVRSGGQTGFDEAGIKAGVALGLPATVLAPRDWNYRPTQKDIVGDEAGFKARFQVPAETPAAVEAEAAQVPAQPETQAPETTTPVAAPEVPSVTETPGVEAPVAQAETGIKVPEAQAYFRTLPPVEQRALRTQWSNIPAEQRTEFALEQLLDKIENEIDLLTDEGQTDGLSTLRAQAGTIQQALEGRKPRNAPVPEKVRVEDIMDRLPSVLARQAVDAGVLLESWGSGEAQAVQMAVDEILKADGLAMETKNRMIAAIKGEAASIITRIGVPAMYSQTILDSVKPVPAGTVAPGDKAVIWYEGRNNEGVYVGSREVVSARGQRGTQYLVQVTDASDRAGQLIATYRPADIRAEQAPVSSETQALMDVEVPEMQGYRLYDAPDGRKTLVHPGYHGQLIIGMGGVGKSFLSRLDPQQIVDTDALMQDHASRLTGTRVQRLFQLEDVIRQAMAAGKTVVTPSVELARLFTPALVLGTSDAAEMAARQMSPDRDTVVDRGSPEADSLAFERFFTYLEKQGIPRGAALLLPKGAYLQDVLTEDHTEQSLMALPARLVSDYIGTAEGADVIGTLAEALEHAGFSMVDNEAAFNLTLKIAGKPLNTVESQTRFIADSSKALSYLMYPYISGVDRSHVTREALEHMLAARSYDLYRKQHPEAQHTRGTWGRIVATVKKFIGTLVNFAEAERKALETAVDQMIVRKDFSVLDAGLVPEGAKVEIDAVQSLNSHPEGARVARVLSSVPGIAIGGSIGYAAAGLRVLRPADSVLHDLDTIYANEASREAAVLKLKESYPAEQVVEAQKGNVYVLPRPGLGIIPHETDPRLGSDEYRVGVSLRIMDLATGDVVGSYEYFQHAHTGDVEEVRRGETALLIDFLPALSDRPGIQYDTEGLDGIRFVPPEDGLGAKLKYLRLKDMVDYRNQRRLTTPRTLEFSETQALVSVEVDEQGMVNLDFTGRVSAKAEKNFKSGAWDVNKALLESGFRKTEIDAIKQFGGDGDLASRVQRARESVLQELRIEQRVPPPSTNGIPNDVLSVRILAGGVEVFRSGPTGRWMVLAREAAPVISAFPGSIDTTVEPEWDGIQGSYYPVSPAAVAQAYAQTPQELGGGPADYENFSVNKGQGTYKEYMIHMPFQVPGQHARFTDPNLAGWFRVREYRNTGIVEIMEIQSELFQKNKEGFAEGPVRLPFAGPRYEDVTPRQTAFLNLLSDQQTWVPVFTQAIAQWARTQGFSEVRFPTGETAAKVEGHTTVATRLQELHRQRERTVEALEHTLESPDRQAFGEDRQRFVVLAPGESVMGTDYRARPDGSWDVLPEGTMDVVDVVAELPAEAVRVDPASRMGPRSGVDFKARIAEIDAEIQRHKTQGIEKLAPIEAFYENRIGKTVDKAGARPVTDAQGNTWRELTVAPVSSETQALMDVEALEPGRYVYAKARSMNQLANRLIFDIAPIHSDGSKRDIGAAHTRLKKRWDAALKHLYAARTLEQADFEIARLSELKVIGLGNKELAEFRRYAKRNLPTLQDPAQASHQIVAMDQPPHLKDHEAMYQQEFVFAPRIAAEPPTFSLMSVEDIVGTALSPITAQGPSAIYRVLMDEHRKTGVLLNPEMYEYARLIRYWGMDGTVRKFVDQKFKLDAGGRPVGDADALTLSREEHFSGARGAKMTPEQQIAVLTLSAASGAMLEYSRDAEGKVDWDGAAKRAVLVTGLDMNIADAESLKRFLPADIVDKMVTLKAKAETEAKKLMAETKGAMSFDQAMAETVKALRLGVYVRRYIPRKSKRYSKSRGYEGPDGRWVNLNYDVSRPVWTVPANWITESFDKDATGVRKLLIDSGRDPKRLTAEALAKHGRTWLDRIRQYNNDNLPWALSRDGTHVWYNSDYAPHFFGTGYLGAEGRALALALDRDVRRAEQAMSDRYKELMGHTVDKKGTPRPLTDATDGMLQYLFDLKGLGFENRAQALEAVKSDAFADFGVHKDMNYADVVTEIHSEIMNRLAERQAAKQDLNTELDGVKNPLALARALTEMKENFRHREYSRRTKQRLNNLTFARIYEKTGLKPANMLGAADMAHRYASDLLKASQTRAIMNQAVLTRGADGAMQIVPVPNMQHTDAELFTPQVWEAMARNLASQFGVKLDVKKSSKQNVADIVESHVRKDTAGYKRLDSPYVSVNEFFAVKPEGGNILDAASGGQVAALLQHVLEQPWQDGSKTIKFLEHLNAWSKMMSVQLSLFFPMAGLESLTALSGGKFWKDGGLKQLMEFNEMVKADHPYTRDLTALADRLGIQFAGVSNPMDLPRGLVASDVQRLADFAEVNFNKGTADAVKSLGSLPLKQTELVFEGFFNSAKLWATHHFYQTLRAKAEAAGVPFDAEAAMKPYAQYINDELGGWSWDRFTWATPTWRRWMQLSLFSPMWTISAANAAGLGMLTSSVFKNSMTPEAANHIMVKRWPTMLAFVMFLVPAAMQGIAYMAAKVAGSVDDDDEYFIWNNEEGKQMHADITPLMRAMPWYEGAPTGERRQYIRWGKQAWEIRNWFDAPWSALLGKTSNVARWALEQATGSAAGNADWPMPYKDMGLMGLVVDKHGGFVGSRMGHTIEKFLPFSLIGWARNPDAKPFQIVGATSKGMSFNRATKAYMGLLDAWAREDTYSKIYNNPRVKANLEALGPEILDAAARNGYDPAKVLTSARGAVLKDVYARLYRALDKNDMKGVERWSRAVARVNGNISGVLRSVKNRNNMYGKPEPISQEQRDAVREAFSRP